MTPLFGQKIVSEVCFFFGSGFMSVSSSSSGAKVLTVVAPVIDPLKGVETYFVYNKGRPNHWLGPCPALDVDLGVVAGVVQEAVRALAGATGSERVERLFVCSGGHVEVSLVVSRRK